jgi:hypothetical protein
MLTFISLLSSYLIALFDCGCVAVALRLRCDCVAIALRLRCDCFAIAIALRLLCNCDCVAIALRLLLRLRLSYTFFILFISMLFYFFASCPLLPLFSHPLVYCHFKIKHYNHLLLLTTHTHLHTTTTQHHHIPLHSPHSNTGGSNETFCKHQQKPLFLGYIAQRPPCGH